MDTKKLRSILTKREIGEILKQFKLELLKNDVIPKYLILFGSYAKNKPNIDSDIDVAIIVRNKEKSIVANKKTDLMYVASKTHLKLEPHFMTENDFDNKYLSLPFEIKKYGIAF